MRILHCKNKSLSRYRTIRVLYSKDSLLSEYLIISYSTMMTLYCQNTWLSEYLRPHTGFSCVFLMSTYLSYSWVYTYHIDTCDVIHTYVQRDSISSFWRDIFIGATWLNYMYKHISDIHSYQMDLCDMTHTYVWRDWFMCDVTRLHVQHDWVICTNTYLTRIPTHS